VCCDTTISTTWQQVVVGIERGIDFGTFFNFVEGKTFDPFELAKMKPLLWLSVMYSLGSAYGAPSKITTESNPFGSNKTPLKETGPELLSLLSTERVPASSKFGKSLLSRAQRQLGNNNNNNNYYNSYDSSWMANYDIVFHHCFNEHDDSSNVSKSGTYVTFYLCSSQYACDPSTCAKKGAQYIVTLQNFLYYYMDLMDETCESMKDNCDYYSCGDDQNANEYGYDNGYYKSCQSTCLQEAGMSHCITSSTSFDRRLRERALSGSDSGDGDGEGSDFGTMKAYCNCAKVAFNEASDDEEEDEGDGDEDSGDGDEDSGDEDSGDEESGDEESGDEESGDGDRKLANYYYQNYYMGPQCSSDGKSIYFGLYTDYKCSAAASKGIYEANSDGYVMPFSEASGSPLVTYNKKSASHCPSCSGGQNKYYQDYAHEDCSTLRIKAVATCEKVLAKQVDGIAPVTTGCATVKEFNHVVKYGVTHKPTFSERLFRLFVFGCVFLVPAALLKTYAKFVCGSTKNTLDDSNDIPYERNQEGTTGWA
jgi:hypothetical protein